jgi:hypothetical protein
MPQVLKDELLSLGISTLQSIALTSSTRLWLPDIAVFVLKITRQLFGAENHDERTKNPEGRQEETGHDPERKEGCEAVKEGNQRFPGH